MCARAPSWRAYSRTKINSGQVYKLRATKGSASLSPLSWRVPEHPVRAAKVVGGEVGVRLKTYLVLVDTKRHSGLK